MHNIYSDLMKEFIHNGDRPYIVTPREKRTGENTELINHADYSILKVRTGNLNNVSLIEKGISTVLIERQFMSAISKYLKGINFGLITYSTPPITFCSAVKKYKKVFNAPTYLMLKDIFPQNSVDLGMLSKSGLKGIIYWYFRNKEKKLYQISDRIGCMSEANKQYILKNNPQIDYAKVEICPNSIEYRPLHLSKEDRLALRKEYSIPSNKIVFVYGGNLGKPQGIPFMIDCLRVEKNNPEAFFVVVGSGSEYGLIASFVESEKPQNVKLIHFLPKDEYDRLMASCDVGLIFLDHRFTIPNFPSRILPYMQAGMPVLACTDPNTDIGHVIVNGGFGWWCESSRPEQFKRMVSSICHEGNICMYGSKALSFLKEQYSVARTYRAIMNFIESCDRAE